MAIVPTQPSKEWKPGEKDAVVAFGWLQLWSEKAGINPLDFHKMWERSFADRLTQAKAEGAERVVRERELAAKTGLCVALAHLNNSKTVRQAIEGINREIDEFDRQSLQEEKLTNPEG